MCHTSPDMGMMHPSLSKHWNQCHVSIPSSKKQIHCPMSLRLWGRKRTSCWSLQLFLRMWKHLQGTLTVDPLLRGRVLWIASAIHFQSSKHASGYIPIRVKSRLCNAIDWVIYSVCIMMYYDVLRRIMMYYDVLRCIVTQYLVIHHHSCTLYIYNIHIYLQCINPSYLPTSFWLQRSSASARRQMYQDTEREVLGSSVGSVGSHEGRELMEGLRQLGYTYCNLLGRGFRTG